MRNSKGGVQAHDYKRLYELKEELPSLLNCEGIMAAYTIISEKVGRSTSEVRRWFTDEQAAFHRPPPQEKAIWEYIEKLFSGRTDRSLYYPPSDFWKKNWVSE